MASISDRIRKIVSGDQPKPEAPAPVAIEPEPDAPKPATPGTAAAVSFPDKLKALVSAPLTLAGSDPLAAIRQDLDEARAAEEGARKRLGEAELEGTPAAQDAAAKTHSAARRRVAALEAKREAAEERIKAAQAQERENARRELRKVRRAALQRIHAAVAEAIEARDVYVAKMAAAAASMQTSYGVLAEGTRSAIADANDYAIPDLMNELLAAGVHFHGVKRMHIVAAGITPWEKRMPPMDHAEAIG